MMVPFIIQLNKILFLIKRKKNCLKKVLKCFLNFKNQYFYSPIFTVKS